jgi:hypothetical protein
LPPITPITRENAVRIQIADRVIAELERRGRIVAL